MCSYHSIPECCVMFSRVKLSMGSFILFICGQFSPMSLPTSQKDNGSFTSNDEETAQYLLEK